eukprot:1158045-Pelagomonas_calceolata.AAC.3
MAADEFGSGCMWQWLHMAVTAYGSGYLWQWLDLLCTQTCTARALRAPALCTQIPCAVIQTYFPCAPRPTPLPHRRKQKPKRPSDVCNFIDSGIQNGI